MRTRAFGFPLLFLLAIAGFSAATMLLWNALLPGIFGIASIGFWQALGLLVLTRILFGGVGGGHFMHKGHGGHRNPLREKWMKMNPDERKEFFRRCHRRAGFFGREGLGEKYCEPENGQN